MRKGFELNTKFGFLFANSLFIFTKIDSLQTDLATFEEDFISEQKAQLKKEVHTLQSHIESRHAAMERQLEEHLKERVEEARMAAQYIYSTMEDSYKKEDIKKVIRESIRPVRFHDKLGYCFILTLAGKAVLYPANTSLEGSDFLSNTMYGDSQTIQNILDLAKEKGHGFYRYHWTKPGDQSGRLYDKIAYVTLFEPLGWVIGTGEYIDALDAVTKKTVIQELKQTLPGDSVDYFFIYQLNNIEGGKKFATMLLNNNRPDLVGREISDDYADAKGNEFRKEFLQGIRKNGEAFVVYWYKKPGGSGIGRKLSYFKLYPDWNWVIAKGIYFDRLDTIIAQRKEQLRSKVKNDIIGLCIIFLVGVTISLITAFFLSRGLQRIFNDYRNTQKEHLEKLESLNNALELQSRTDGLTQIYNRTYFNEQLAFFIAASERYQTPVSIIIFDIDHFKNINDKLGHFAGDSVLKELTLLISSNTRKCDVFARWGGEEFTILAPNITLEQTTLFMEKLRKKVENHTFSIGKNITCSFGGSTHIPLEGSEDLLRRADMALYQAKNNGRNQSVTL